MIAYFDCFSGISGDMILGALVDLGVPLNWLEKQLHNLPLDGFELSQASVKRHGITATQVTVAVAEKQHARHFTDIATLIEQSKLPVTVRKRSLAIFKKLGQAEAAVHDCSLEEVHFHEVGSVDAIVDIVGSVLGLAYLDVQDVFASKIPLGSGFVTCDHGVLPLPAPATAAILKDVPVYGSGVEKELVTPTGASVITTIATTFGVMPDITIEKIGYGAGQRILEDRPNLLRVMLGQAAADTPETAKTGIVENAVMVECAIDDMNPELFGYLMDRLFADGALDVYWLPVQMKKNRPGTLVQVLCNPNKKHAITTRLLSETTTAGVRYYPVERRILKRELIEADTRYGPISAKKIFGPDDLVRITPEYESCRKIAAKQKLPIVEVYENACYDLRVDNAGQIETSQAKGGSDAP
jgi:pyridinium-3,5-bisthiocarboxylic acid mononucleotide nickel chelatase